MKVKAGLFLHSSALAMMGLAMETTAMSYEPFHFCTETHQIDSIAHIEWPSGEGDFATPMTEGWAYYSYQPHSCLLSSIRQLTAWGDTILSEISPSPIGYVVRIRAEDSTGADGGIWARVWFAPDGRLDSTFYFDDSTQLGNLKLARQIHKRKVSPPYEIIEEYYQDTADSLTLYLLDSVHVEGNKTIIRSMEDGDRLTTTCTDAGSLFTCIPEAAGPNTWNLRTLVWHLTQGRKDSLQTFDEDGKLLFTDRFFWSARSQSGIRVGKRKLSRTRLQPKSVPVNALGRRLWLPNKDPRQGVDEGLDPVGR